MAGLMALTAALLLTTLVSADEDYWTSTGGYDTCANSPWGLIAHDLIRAPVCYGSGKNEPACGDYVTRRQWGADESASLLPPLAPYVTKVIVHHTNATVLDCADSFACTHELKRAQNLMFNMGWLDIGWHWLINRHGQVYEGRGWDVMGGHTLGHNMISYGIAFIGDYETERANGLMVKALLTLLDCGVKQGHLSADYTIHTHADVMCSNCPGEAMRKQMTRWRHYGGDVGTGCKSRYARN